MNCTMMHGSTNIKFIKINLKWEVDFIVYRHLVLRPSCVAEKVGVNQKRCKSKMIFPYGIME
jgi:hypothetical protein